MQQCCVQFWLFTFLWILLGPALALNFCFMYTTDFACTRCLYCTAPFVQDIDSAPRGVIPVVRVNSAALDVGNIQVSCRMCICIGLVGKTRNV